MTTVVAPLAQLRKRRRRHCRPILMSDKDRPASGFATAIGTISDPSRAGQRCSPGWRTDATAVAFSSSTNGNPAQWTSWTMSRRCSARRSCKARSTPVHCHCVCCRCLLRDRRPHLQRGRRRRCNRREEHFPSSNRRSPRSGWLGKQRIQRSHSHSSRRHHRRPPLRTWAACIWRSPAPTPASESRIATGAPKRLGRRCGTCRAPAW
mmetsp:Transcript_108488/g.312529  ORF Transcript_108488/g.312529 Transcript_108488/m.312529 type:complete len:207 (-) Transcript_108488:111-731(-)